MDKKREILYQSLCEKIDSGSELTDDGLRNLISRIILQKSKELSLTFEERRKYREILFSAIRRYDILSVIMDDRDVTEIMVNGSNHIYIEKAGRIRELQEGFTTSEKLYDIIQQMASGVNRRVNETTPMVDAGLPDGSRVNIVLPPVSLNGPAVTIRRFSKEIISMEKLVSWGAISEEAASFLKTLVKSGYNIFVSGGTGAGKTTFLGALAAYIPEDERVITIEDSAELRLKNVKNLVRLESRPANIDGEHEITIRDLIKNALRMRPDRIVVGEIRGPEAIDMLMAMNTGHDGSLSTGHANSAYDMLSRIETMVLMGMDIPLMAVRAQIASAIDIFVHLGRLRDKSRRVLGIYETAGIRNGQIELQALFEFHERGIENGRIIGSLEKTDQELSRCEKLERAGYRL